MTAEPQAAAPPRQALNPLLKFTLELGPVLLFFVVYRLFDIFAATAAMMVAVVVTLLVSYTMLKRIPVMPLVTAVIVLIFGSLTLLLHDRTIIKLKVTVLYLLFSGALFYGLIFDKPLLKIVFDGALHVTKDGWRKLTWRWGFFFLGLALLNEVVWRTQSEDFWVTFKTYGVTPLTILFAIAQTPLILRHDAKGAPEEDAF